jgi:hypothetical protein
MLPHRQAITANIMRAVGTQLLRWTTSAISGIKDLASVEEGRGLHLDGQLGPELCLRV